MPRRQSQPYYMEDLLAICEKYKEQELPIDVLRDLSQTSQLMMETEHLRDLMHRDPHGIFDKKEFGAKLSGEGAKLTSLLQVQSIQRERTLDGRTTINACVDLLPRTNSTVQFHFHFRRRPMTRGMSISSSMTPTTANNISTSRKRGRPSPSPSPQEAEEEDEEEEEGSFWKLEPTTIVEYVIQATTVSSLSPPIEILQVVIHGMSEDGSPSASGVRGLGDALLDDLASASDDKENEGTEEAGASDHEENGGTEAGERGKAKEKPPLHDFALAVVDEEALAKIRTWTKTTLDPVEFLLFLMNFPYWEEEWDVAGILIDQVLGADGDSEEEEEVIATVKGKKDNGPAKGRKIAGGGGYPAPPSSSPKKAKWGAASSSKGEGGANGKANGKAKRPKH